MNDESTPKGAHESATTGLMVQPPTDIAQEARRGESALTFEDRQQAIAVAFEAGRHYQTGLDVEVRARAMLVEWSNESRNMAMEYASKVGPGWLAVISDCGGSE